MKKIIKNILAIFLVLILVIGSGFYSYGNNGELPEDITDPEETIVPEDQVGTIDSDETVNPEVPIEPDEPATPEDIEIPLASEQSQVLKAPIEVSPSIKMIVTTEKDIYKPGELINYTIVVSNTGGVGLEDVTLIDKLVGGKDLGELVVQSEIVLNEYYLIPEDFTEEVLSNSIFVEGFYQDISVNSEVVFEVRVLIEEPVDDMYIIKELDENWVPTEEGFQEYIAEPMKYLKADLLEDPTYEDTIEVDKTVEITNGCRAFEVTIDITGTPPPKPVDVVLVIDRSNDMGPPEYGYPDWTNSIAYAKSAAKDFTEILLTNNPNARVAVVYFGFNAWSWQNGTLNNSSWIAINFSNNVNSIKSAIDGISVSGGTNTEAGFTRAKQVIDRNGRTGVDKAVILLSNGLPTASIGYPYDNDINSNTNIIHRERAKAAAASMFKYVDVFTVGLFDQLQNNPVQLAVARDVISKSQNSGYFETFKNADLSDIYNQTFHQLEYSATNGVVTDIIGLNFEFVSFTEPEPDNPYKSADGKATYDPSTHTITWTSGTILTHSQLKYKIRANKEFEGGERVPTNESAIFNYTDVNGNPNAEKVFPVPKVNVPSPLKIASTDAEIIVGDSINLGEHMDISGGYSPYTYKWTIEDKTWESLEQNPEVSPEDDTYYTLEVTDKWGCKKKAKLLVKVKKGSITITKTVNNLKDKDKNKKFAIWIYGPEGKAWAVLLKSGESTTIEGLRLGDYRISEVVPMNFTLNSISSNSIDITREKLNHSVSVINKRNNDGWFTDEDKVENRFTVMVKFASDVNTDNENKQNNIVANARKVLQQVFYDYKRKLILS